MSFLIPHRSRRHGMTLTELLVVISIIVLVAGAFVPMLQPLTRGRRVREASRQVNVFISGAQARAVEQGRPVGIWLERAAHEPNQPINLWYTCYRMYVAEQPEPYTGDLFDSRVIIEQNPAFPTRWLAYFKDPDPAAPQSFPCCDNLVASRQVSTRMINAGQEPTIAPLASVGDLIRFEERGPHYMISAIDNEKFEFLVNPIDVPHLAKYKRQVVPPGMSSTEIMASRSSYQAGVRFSVMRRPVKSSAAPLELPRNTAIDLSVSGYGGPFESPQAAIYNSVMPGTIQLPLNPARFRNVSPEYDIAIMFHPRGGIDRVYYITHEPDPPTGLSPTPTFWEIPQGALYLLIARDEAIGRDGQKNPTANLSVDYIKNIATTLGEGSLQDQDNLWLSLTTQSGRVMTAPNKNPFLAPSGLDDISDARSFAMLGRSMGGN